MKSLALGCFLCASGAALAASVDVGNINDFSDTNAIVDNAGNPISAGSGYVAIGYFDYSGDFGLVGTGELLSTFVQYGNSGSFLSEGLFQFAANGPSLDGSEFVGRDLYVVVTEGDSVAGSSQVFIFDPGVSFPATEPYVVSINVQSGEGAVARGGLGNFSVDFGEGPVAAFNMVLIPEPATAALGLMGGLFLLRRRR